LKGDRTLVLGLGNELLSDDGIGITAIRALRDKAEGHADLVETSMCGMALLDYFIGYRRAIIIDAISTKKVEPGSILEFTPADLDSVIAPSPHYAGLPEMLAVAKSLELEFPEEIKIYAIEVADPYTIGGGISDAVRASIPPLVDKVLADLEAWRMEDSNA
jgi:hydrogenase maturation protease